MRNVFIIITTLFIISWTTQVSAVFAQGKIYELTAEEKKAAQDIGDRFMQRLAETGDVEPLIKEMFVNDFMQRYVKARKHELSAGKEASTNITFGPGIEYSSSLLDKPTDEEWRQLYVSMFNFQQYGFMVAFNMSAKSLLNGDEMDEKVIDNIFPKGVMNILDADPILCNLIQEKNNQNIIKTIDEFRRVNKTLSAAINLLHSGNYKNKVKMLDDARKVLKTFKEKAAKEMEPSLVFADEESFGFPKGTRFVRVFASVTHVLIVVRLGGEYKIVGADFVAID